MIRRTIFLIFMSTFSSSAWAECPKLNVPVCDGSPPLVKDVETVPTENGQLVFSPICRGIKNQSYKVFYRDKNCQAKEIAIEYLDENNIPKVDSESGIGCLEIKALPAKGEFLCWADAGGNTDVNLTYHYNESLLSLTKAVEIARCNENDLSCKEVPKVLYERKPN